jgi:hypothetical protein
MQKIHFLYSGERNMAATGSYRFPHYLCTLFIEGCTGNRYDHAGSLTGSFSTTTMVKESFTTGNSEVSRRDMPSYLMRWLLVDKLQGEVTPCGSVRACQKIVGFGAGLGE